MTQAPFYIHEDDSPGKARILTESLRLFARNGLAATSIRDIAQATGMTNPALYKHFKTRHDLAVVLFERLYRAHRKELVVATQNADGFAASFEAFITTYLKAYDMAPEATIFTTDNLVALWPEVAQDLKSDSVITLLRDLLEGGRLEGVVADESDLDLQMSLVLGLLAQLTRQLYFGAVKGPAARHAAGVLRLLKSGLA